MSSPRRLVVWEFEPYGWKFFYTPEDDEMRAAAAEKAKQDLKEETKEEAKEEDECEPPTKKQNTGTSTFAVVIKESDWRPITVPWCLHRVLHKTGTSTSTSTNPKREEETSTTMLQTSSSFDRARSTVTAREDTE